MLGSTFHLIARCSAGPILFAAAIAAAQAGTEDITVQARNQLDRQILVTCEVEKGFHRSTSTINVPAGQTRLVWRGVRVPARPGETLSARCGAFEFVNGGKGEPIFPHAGPGGMSPIGLKVPEDGQRQVTTYVAKMPQPHYE